MNDSQIKRTQEQIALHDLLITVSDARCFFGGCIPGWKTFAETYGLDWKVVTRHGLLASQLMATGDAMAISLVCHMYEKESF